MNVNLFVLETKYSVVAHLAHQHNVHIFTVSETNTITLYFEKTEINMVVVWQSISKCLFLLGCSNYGLWYIYITEKHQFGLKHNRLAMDFEFGKGCHPRNPLGNDLIVWPIRLNVQGP